MKKCMEYEVEGARPTGRPRKPGQRLCKKIVKHREDAWLIIDGGSR